MPLPSRAALKAGDSIWLVRLQGRFVVSSSKPSEMGTDKGYVKRRMNKKGRIKQKNKLYEWMIDSV